MGDRVILEQNKKMKKEKNGNKKLFSALKEKPFSDDVKYLKVDKWGNNHIYEYIILQNLESSFLPDPKKGNFCPRVDNLIVRSAREAIKYIDSVDSAAKK